MTTTATHMTVGPGFARIPYQVMGFTASRKALTARALNYDGAPVEVFTLRKNGHYALKGEGMWSCFIKVGGTVTKGV